MHISPQTAQQIGDAVRQDRLVDTAIKLIEIPSPTRSARQVLDCLAAILQNDGFQVERPEVGYPDAPAVAARFSSGNAGRTLQFNGHLDTVHLPFVPPRVKNGLLYGSGAIDMKGGVAAAVEAMRVLRDTQLLTSGSILLTAHDLHEAPWGDGSQVDGLIDEGYLGDAVLLPEYLTDVLPVVGRGLAFLEVDITRDGEPVHEVMGGLEQPSVIAAGADVVQRFEQADGKIAGTTHPLAGRESLFIGQIAAGEIYNTSPVQCKLRGTRRWLPGTAIADLRQQYEKLLSEVSVARHVHIDGRFICVRDACQVEESEPIVAAIQQAHTVVSGGPLPIGAKPFVDDGNTFIARGKIPAVTHGPRGKGAHTLHEEVSVEDMCRVATVYALAAVEFC